MSIRSAAAALAALVFVSTPGAAASAAEIKVWSGGAFREAMGEVGPRFERASGHKLVVEFAASPEFAKRVEAGQTFDAAILLPETIDAWLKAGKIIANTHVNVARVALGIAVHAGAPKPDVGTVDAFKRTLLDAKAVAYFPGGEIGKHFASVLERLELAADIKARLKPAAAGGASPMLVARGEAEVAVAFVPAILATPGVQLAGPFPPGLAYHIDLSGGVGSSAKDPEAAKAFIRFLVSSEGIAATKAKGLESIAP